MRQKCAMHTSLQMNSVARQDHLQAICLSEHEKCTIQNN